MASRQIVHQKVTDTSRNRSKKVGGLRPVIESITARWVPFTVSLVMAFPCHLDVLMCRSIKTKSSNSVSISSDPFPKLIDAASIHVILNSVAPSRLDACNWYANDWIALDEFYRKSFGSNFVWRNVRSQEITEIGYLTQKVDLEVQATSETNLKWQQLIVKSNRPSTTHVKRRFER